MATASTGLPGGGAPADIEGSAAAVTGEEAAFPERERQDRAVVLFDGSCNLCHRLVAFLSRVDQGGVLDLAPLESATGRAALAPTDLDAASVVGLVLVEEGQAVTRSEAVWRALHLLPSPWPTVAGALRLVPRRVRDAAYDVVARNRYRLFGRADQCPVPSRVPPRRP